MCGNLIKRQKQHQMAKINKSRGANSRIYGSSGGLFEGSLLRICSPRAGAYSRGPIRGFTVFLHISWLAYNIQVDF